MMGANVVRRAAVAAIAALAMVLGSAGSAVGARRVVSHLSGASAIAAFSTCGDVADGDPCSYTLVAASRTRPEVGAFAGACLFIEHIVGYRAGPTSIALGYTQFAQVCHGIRVTIPRSLIGARARGTVPTEICRSGPGDHCRAADEVRVDLSWTGIGPSVRTHPQTLRFLDDLGSACVQHRGHLADRSATASGSIAEFGPLGVQLHEPWELSSGGILSVGQLGASCLP